MERLGLRQLRCGTKASDVSSPFTKKVHCETQLLPKVEGIRYSHVGKHVSSLLFDSPGFCLKISKNIINPFRRMITDVALFCILLPLKSGRKTGKELFELFLFASFPLVLIISLD